MASALVTASSPRPSEAAGSKQQGRNTGPLGTGSHVVREGECLLSIAYQHGFLWKTIWNLPANAQLRQKRKDPGQLVVGDRIMIPERAKKEVQAATDKRHRFVKRAVPAKLRLVVEYEDEPVSNAAYVLLIDGSILEGRTDDQGLLEASIPPDASEGILEINGLHFELLLGALDPSSEDVGIQQRLANLGFYHGEIDGRVGPLTREAISTFQARAGLDVTGELDDVTLGKLMHRHDETHERLPPEAGPEEAAPAAGRKNG
jgi:Putative peptidoglycan binding domain